ncbi:hypothetical protein HD806DRAFT_533821 [Xylariaceae sp. AK1471]|nr:hypothetical protein HD806DRAFT_533821 [Xylariaceae sp. AK1471]
MPRRWLRVSVSAFLFILLGFVGRLFLDSNSSISPIQPDRKTIRSSMSLRAATKADLDQITSLGIAALHDDPIWPYRFPKAAEFPEDHRHYSRLRFSEYLENVENGVYAATVVEVPSEEDASVNKIIAMSMWGLPGSHLPNTDPSAVQGKQATRLKTPADSSERRDADPKRMNKFRQELGKAKKAWFDDVYGNDQLNLLILATHPEYRRLGAAARLVAWGQEEAKAEGIPVTVFSSPMGFPLYTKMGFTQIGSVHVQVDGDDAFTDLPGMVWNP